MGVCLAKPNRPAVGPQPPASEPGTPSSAGSREAGADASQRGSAGCSVHDSAFSQPAGEKARPQFGLESSYIALRQLGRGVSSEVWLCRQVDAGR